MNRSTSLLLLLVLFAACSTPQSNIIDDAPDIQVQKKLYWFIPDGMRAEPDLFNIYKWAEEGKLPNIKIMMDSGSYGFSKPVFPSHTPTNFATLLTGTYPKVHGVADGPMHTEGNPLNVVSVGGFRSSAKKTTPIWNTLEDSDRSVFLLSMPGSTPPEINGMVIRGRWGGWGADYHALNFESKLDSSQRVSQGRGSRLFFFGPQLTNYLDAKEISPDEANIYWKTLPESYSAHKLLELNGWGSTVHAMILDGSDDELENYDSVAFKVSAGEAQILTPGEWSEWMPITLKWAVDGSSIDVASHVKAHVIKLDEDGFFRLRLFYNNLNEYNVQPQSLADDFNTAIGPMADFVDNFPPQLIYYPEDKNTFLDEAEMTFNWHEDAVHHIMETYDPQVVLHDIYTPNQMLTSRWWMGYIDPSSDRYADVSDTQREVLWSEVEWMYKELDGIIGKILEEADENTVIVLSSDHGAVPLNKWVRLNNLFAEEGLLKFEIDQSTGEPIIDWENTKAIYLKMDSVYISPTGLAGDWKRSSGKEYEKLRDDVTKLLMDLEDEHGTKPIASVVEWEDVEDVLDLPADRVGDLVIANKAGYGWNEEMSADHAIFEIPLKTGYKQAILPDEEKGMWTPFIIMGPGVAKGHYIEEPIDHVDQYPTILTLLGVNIPEANQGTLIDEILI